MFVRTLAYAVLAALSSLAVAATAQADFALVSQDLTVNAPQRSLQFALKFNQAPDFNSVAADGTPDNSFQVEFAGAADPSTSLPGDITAVVRGDEIHTAHAVRIRSALGDGGPDGGGWGPVVKSVPFEQFGNTVTFAVPTDALGWTGGAWQANIFSLQAGALTAQQSVSSIPAPPAFWAGLAGLAAVAVWSWRQAVARRRGGRAYFAG